MAKRKKVQSEDRLLRVTKILKPECHNEVIKIFKSVAVMMDLRNFRHENTDE